MSGRPVVLVTGASGGVGEGIALACAEGGYEVWIGARREGEGRRVASAVDARGGVGAFVRCDVAQEDEVAHALSAIVSRSGRLDAIVHNATSGYSSVPHLPRQIGLDEIEDQVQVALRGLYFLAHHGHRHLRDAGGSLVVTTSEAGFEGKRRLAAYAAVKAAQRAMARVLAREWGADGIRVNCVAPLASSPAMEQAFEKDPTMAQRVFGRIPLGRLGEPEGDIGTVVRFLLGPDAGYVTGQTIMVDGGSCPIT